jgi:arsenate reductase (thioredoxin)
MVKRVHNALFLCGRNSARSIFGEALLNKLGRGRFHAYSAGSHSRGEVNPHTLELLRRLHFPTDGLRSKSWDEFAKPGAPKLDFVITVCDSAAAETCPIWPGQPMTAHWSVPDPAAVEESEEHIRRAFSDAFVHLQRRVLLFVSLPLEKLNRLSLQKRLDDIGKKE